MSGVLHGIVASLKAAAAAATDAFFEYVTLLLHGDGTNGAQNNTFLDGSTNNFTITRNGNTTQGSFSPFSQTGWSNYFDGTGDYLSVADNAALDLGSGDFTIELWAYYLATGGGSGRGTIAKGTTTGASFLIFQGASNELSFYASSTGTSWDIASNVQFTASLQLNTWHHIAVTRSGTTFRLFLNGTQANTFTSSASLIDNASAVDIGTYGASAANAYISNVRILKGTAQYTANFTPPTAPLTAITNTSLLTCQSNRFIDNSSNAFTITRNGDVRVEAFSPFNPTAAWSASTNGGSGYFDGTGDWVTAPSNAALSLSTSTVDFTLEAWVYPNSFGGALTTIVALWPQSVGQDQYILATDTTGALSFYWAPFNTSSVFISGGILQRSTWSHVAVTRSGNTFRLFLNGSQVASGTSTGTTGVDNLTSVGRFGDGSTGTSPTSYWNGYIANARIVKGTAVYTANFTPPTAPLTAITNTSLLLNFTNAGIYDNASQTVLETVGNAQVSTTQKKYGTGSMYFDGTGDWLIAPDRPPLRFGTGAFTIECWLYLGATGAARGIIAKGTSTTGWLLSTDASNKVVFTYATSTITSTAALSGSTWYHIAVVRQGTGANQTKIYIDGTNDGTGTVSTDFNQTSVMYIGANRTGGDALNGYIDDLRITNGYARYTGNFTPPTAAFPDN